MENFINIIITVCAFIISIFLVTLVHELGHYFVARYIMKEPNIKINMGFFGKPIVNAKRLRINSLFFFGGYIGGYSNGAGTRFHNILLFMAGGVFTVLLGIPIALYISGGSISLGDFIPFFGASPLRENLFSVPMGQYGFVIPWLSLATPFDFFNAFMVLIRNMVGIFVLIAFLPYSYPFRGGWNPSDGLWVLKYIFNKVSEKDEEYALNAVSEKDEK